MDTTKSLFDLSDQMHMPIVFSDPDMPDCPVIHCNPKFEDMTGYDKSVLVGQNCRILQGPDTDEHAKSVIRRATTERAFGSAVLLNYRADGSPFNNFLFIEAITLAGGKQILMGCQNEFKTFRSPSEIALGSADILQQHQNLLLNFHEHQVVVQDALKMRAETAVVMVRNYLLRRRAQLDVKS